MSTKTIVLEYKLIDANGVEYGDDKIILDNNTYFNITDNMSSGKIIKLEETGDYNTLETKRAMLSSSDIRIEKITLYGYDTYLYDEKVSFTIRCNISSEGDISKTSPFHKDDSISGMYLNVYCYIGIGEIL